MQPLDTPVSKSKFSVGDLVHHVKFDYRGVIVDVDADFQLTEAWYNEMAVSHPPKDQPWYHVLVDKSSQVTYVAERNLAPDLSGNPVSHPLLDDYFSDFKAGRYRAGQRHN